MTNTEIIILSATGTIVLIVLLLAAYLHGHHNGRQAKSVDKPKPREASGSINPAFVLQTIEDGVIMVDGQGVIRLFNPAAEHITGWRQDEVVGLDFRSVLTLVDEHGQAYKLAAQPFNRALQTDQTVRDNNAVLVTRTKKQVPISLIVSPIGPAEGGGAIGVFRDVTKAKAEENERAEFISTASHEMRTPIASIEGYLSLILNSKTTKIDTQSREYLGKAHSATEHLGQLFQDLLTTTRAEDSRLTSHPEAVNLGQVIAEVVENIRPAADKKKLSLHFLASGETGSKVVRPLYFVNADPLRLKEVFQNLLDNAVKYTNAGSITVKLTGDSSVVQVQVGDTGPGISPEDIPHLFQKFYRVDSSLTRQVGGTGLGLYICRRILELYSGRIWVESRLGKGSTFFVNLPRLDSQLALSSQPVNSVVQSKQA